MTRSFKVSLFFQCYPGSTGSHAQEGLGVLPLLPWRFAGSPWTRLLHRSGVLDGSRRHDLEFPSIARAAIRGQAPAPGPPSLQLTKHVAQAHCQLRWCGARCMAGGPPCGGALGSSAIACRPAAPAAGPLVGHALAGLRRAAHVPCIPQMWPGCFDVDEAREYPYVDDKGGT